MKVTLTTVFYWRFTDSEYIGKNYDDLYNKCYHLAVWLEPENTKIQYVELGGIEKIQHFELEFWL